MGNFQIKIKNRQYLKDGRHYWIGSLFDAILIFENGYSFLSMHELIEAFEIFSSDFTFLEKWTFEEIICSTLSFLSENQPLSSCNWRIVCIYLLCAESSNISNTLLLFLQENFPIDEISVKKQDLLFLCDFAYYKVNINNLKNFLNFLNIEKKYKENLIKECVEINNYVPLRDFFSKPESTI